MSIILEGGAAIAVGVGLAKRINDWLVGSKEEHEKEEQAEYILDDLERVMEGGDDDQLSAGAVKSGGDIDTEEVDAIDAYDVKKKKEEQARQASNAHNAMAWLAVGEEEEDEEEGDHRTANTTSTAAASSSTSSSWSEWARVTTRWWSGDGDSEAEAEQQTLKELDEDAVQVLVHAALKGDVDTVRKQVATYGLSVTQPLPYVPSGSSLLHVAALNDTIALLSWLVQATDSASINCTDELGQTPLHAAAQSLNVRAVEILLQFGANPAQPDANGVLPAHLCLQHAPLQKILAKDSSVALEEEWSLDDDDDEEFATAVAL